MSVRVMAAVFDNGPAAAPDRLMLLAIADHADDSGLAWPSLARLAHKCCVEERAARSTLRRLERDGWIATELGGGSGRTSRYRINLAALTRSQATAADQGNPVVHDPGGVQSTTPITRSSTTPEPSVQPSVEPPLSVVTPSNQPEPVADRPPSRPIPIPRGWEPTPAAIESFERRFGRDIDVSYSVLRFVAYYVEHSDKKSSDWTAKCAQWLAKDASDVKSKRPDPHGPDDLGLPRWLHARMDGKGQPRAETDAEREARTRLEQIMSDMDKNRRQA